VLGVDERVGGQASDLVGVEGVQVAASDLLRFHRGVHFDLRDVPVPGAGDNQAAVQRGAGVLEFIAAALAHLLDPGFAVDLDRRHSVVGLGDQAHEVRPPCVGEGLAAVDERLGSSAVLPEPSPGDPRQPPGRFGRGELLGPGQEPVPVR
jgi:hypothetical protein